jgi:hypothetical protein
MAAPFPKLRLLLSIALRRIQYTLRGMRASRFSVTFEMSNKVVEDDHLRPAKLHNPLEDEKLLHLVETPANNPTGTDISSTHYTPDSTREHETRELPKFGGRMLDSLPPRLPVEHHSSAGLDSLNTIPFSNASVWTKYVRKHQIELDGLVIIAQEKRPLGNRVLIRHISKENLDQKIRLLAQFRRKSVFLKTSEVFRSGPTVHAVCEYVDLTLLHLLGCPRFATEKEVAAIAGQGRRLCRLCLCAR